MIGSPNIAFICKKLLMTTFHSVKFVDTIFPAYKQKIGGHRRTLSLFSTVDLLKWSNEKAIYMGIGDTYYPNFMPLTMDEFKLHLYIYHFYGLSPYPRIQM